MRERAPPLPSPPPLLHRPSRKRHPKAPLFPNDGVGRGKGHSLAPPSPFAQAPLKSTSLAQLWGWAREGAPALSRHGGKRRQLAYTSYQPFVSSRGKRPPPRSRLPRSPPLALRSVAPPSALPYSSSSPRHAIDSASILSPSAFMTRQFCRVTTPHGTDSGNGESKRAPSSETSRENSNDGSYRTGIP